MKIFLSLCLLVSSLASLASTGESKTFVYDGTQKSTELVLRGEKTHTEYRYESRPATCYRTVLVGYRTICFPGGPRNPFPMCTQQPDYRTVPYACTQTVQIPYEVKDFDVEARVIVDVTKLSELATPGETINVSLQGDQLTVSASGSKKFFIMLTKQEVQNTVRGSVKYLDGLYALELIEAAPVLNALNMTNISYEDDGLNFVMGPVATTANLSFSLYVERRKLGADRVLFNRVLTDKEFTLKTNGNVTTAVVDVEKLGVSIGGGKYAFTPSVTFKGNGTLLNKGQFGELETSRTLILKN